MEVPPINSQLIIGTEYSEITNKKEWFCKRGNKTFLRSNSRKKL